MRTLPFVLLVCATFAGVSPSARAAEGDEACFPACRSGFVCAKGACVSACNPPCSSSETCTPSGECAAASTSPASTSPASSSAANTPEPPAEEEWHHPSLSPLLGIGAGAAFGSTFGTLGYVRAGADIGLSDTLYLQVDGNLFVHSLPGTDDSFQSSPRLTGRSAAAQVAFGYDFSARFSARAGLLAGWGSSAMTFTNCGSGSQDGAVYGGSAGGAVRWGKTHRWELGVLGHVMVVPNALCRREGLGTPAVFRKEPGDDLVGSASVSLSYHWW